VSCGHESGHEITTEKKTNQAWSQSGNAKVKAQAQAREEQHGACEKTKGAVATEDISPSMATPAILPDERPSFPERSRKRKMRRKTRTLRTARQGTQLLKPTVVVRNIWLL